MRDHRELQVFQNAHRLVKDIYRLAKFFPSEERFGLTSQIQRAVVSVASNIVEGCARSTTREFLRFVEIAHSSSRELGYQLLLAKELGFAGVTPEVEDLADQVSRQLAKLLQSLEDPTARRKTQDA